MPSRIQHCCFLLAALLVAAPAARAGGVLSTTEFADVVGLVQQAVAEHGAEKVLLVCDIDNTLLAMDGELGSDQWFEWQSYLLDNEPESPHLVAGEFEELLAVQGLLFTLGRMHATEAELPKQIASLQQTGLRTLVLTSRGDDFRRQTERELRAAGYDFQSTAVRLVNTPHGVYAPYNLASIEDSGLTAAEAERFQLRPEPRGVSYSAGVFMSSGQHKGAMLLTVLARCESPVDAVVFVDDHGRHVLRVFDALVARGIDTTVVHYQREDENVARFRYSDKQDVAERWRKLDETLDAVFKHPPAGPRPARRVQRQPIAQ